MAKYITIFLFVVVIVLVIVYWKNLAALFTKKTAPTTPVNTNTGTTTGTNTPAPTTPTLDYDKVLKNGVTGPEVQLLQRFLYITADGIFGPATETALYSARGVRQITLRDWIDNPVLFHYTDNATSTDSTGLDSVWQYII